jgi:hypothetical protein
MQRLLERPGYRLYSPDSPEASALLAEQGLGPADLQRALAGLERSEGISVRAIAGINEDGVFGVTRAGWRPDLSDAYREPFIPLLWVKVHELLGRVPAGSHRPVRQGRHAAERRHHLPAGQLKEVTVASKRLEGRGRVCRIASSA